ncbi:facilitated trehalose transporter Tret1 [Rhipicephalus sanguineus]|uniref:facilitated trehalose transporter Tret1 n=1 Tax=Rhipicephalus sanguineus TaxID=34632 RepID=UPI001895ACDA|nr:facilitated trehalose transporter Tret1 [Rhipicephalus sanguineus]
MRRKRPYRGDAPPQLPMEEGTSSHDNSGEQCITEVATIEEPKVQDQGSGHPILEGRLRRMAVSSRFAADERLALCSRDGGDVGLALVAPPVGYSIGLGPVVWILSAELVPCRNRGFYLGAATAFNWICALVVTWLFGVLRETYHYSGMGWFFSSLTFVGAMLVNYFLPETQGHSLEQILLRQFREREDTSIQSTRP